GSGTAPDRPHHDAATEAHGAQANVDKAGVPQRLHGPVDRVAAVVLRDVRPQEAADPVPVSSAGEPSPRGEDQPRVQPPPEVPEAAARHAAFEAGDRGSWLPPPG